MAIRCKHVFAVERCVNKWWQNCHLCKHKYRHSRNMAECQICHVFAHGKCLQQEGIKEQETGKPVSYVDVADRRATCGGNVQPGKMVMASTARQQQQQHVDDGQLRSILKKRDGDVAAVKRRVTFAPVVTSFTIKPHVPIATTRYTRRTLPLIFEMPGANVEAEMAAAEGVMLPKVAKFVSMYKSRVSLGDAPPTGFALGSSGWLEPLRTKQQAPPSRQARWRRRRRQSNADRSAMAD